MRPKNYETIPYRGGRRSRMRWEGPETPRRRHWDRECL